MDKICWKFQRRLLLRYLMTANNIQTILPSIITLDIPIFFFFFFCNSKCLEIHYANKFCHLEVGFLINCSVFFCFFCLFVFFLFFFFKNISITNFKVFPLYRSTFCNLLPNRGMHSFLMETYGTSDGTYGIVLFAIQSV